MKVAVIAFGGNVLLPPQEKGLQKEQKANAVKAARDMVSVVEKGYGTPVFTKIVDLGWPTSATVSESFSYYGYSGTLTLRSESILGMITKVQGLLQVQGSSQQLFTEMTPTGPDAAYKDRVVEYYQKPFVVRLTVISVNNVSGALTGSTYIESLRLYVEVFYLG